MTRFIEKIFLLIALFCFSCNGGEQTFENLPEISSNHGSAVALKARSWLTLYEPEGAFDLRIVNRSGTALEQCTLVLDDKYIHSIEGVVAIINNKLTSDTLKNSTINNGDSITISYDKEKMNVELFFQWKNLFKVPAKIKLMCKTDTLEWDFSTKSKVSYF